MEVTQLRALVAVIDEDGFTGAADRLGVTQSSVSRAVAALERNLGIPLLVRGPRGVHTLTGIGARVAEQARHILDRIELIDALARSEREEATGSLRLGIMPSVGPLLAPLIAAFSREHPCIRITLLEGRDDELTQWLSTDFIDAATMATNVPLTITQPDMPSVPEYRLTDDRWMAVLPTDHPLAKLPIMQLGDLEDDTFLMSGGGCEPLVRDIYDRVGLTCRIDFKIADTATLLTLVREGMGITIVPELSVADFTGISVIPVDTELQRRVYLTATADPARRTISRFLDFVSQHPLADVGLHKHDT